MAGLDNQNGIKKTFSGAHTPAQSEDDSCQLLQDSIDRSREGAQNAQQTAETLKELGFDDTKVQEWADRADTWRENGKASQETFDAVCKPMTPMS